MSLIVVIMAAVVILMITLMTTAVSKEETWEVNYISVGTGNRTVFPACIRVRRLSYVTHMLPPQCNSFTVLQTCCSSVFLRVTVLETDSGVAQAVVSQAGSERRVVFYCRHYRGCCLAERAEPRGETADNSSL